MPIAQYTNMHRSISINRSMPTPKRMAELRYWLKEAQKWIPQIPRVIAESEASASRAIGDDGWFVANTDVTIKWIKFNLENRIGEKAHLVINREAKF